ncbi:hypothetical protein ACFFQF_25470 [Haladaptatus pallidirubidus]|uniref:Uncharacterized protein n=1 Tax=Haladaptatus pallidirubidus TaxID=1008152 RepID=A0AAV3UGH3_9EURY|nr:hypothetical protein [Haladaptatus pallidirubidus]
MDESHLQNQLSRIRFRQYLILTLLIIPDLYIIAEVIGFWSAGVLGTMFALGVFAMVVVNHRSSRTAAGR